jgi:hypothetical protein
MAIFYPMIMECFLLNIFVSFSLKNLIFSTSLNFHFHSLGLYSRELSWDSGTSEVNRTFLFSGILKTKPEFKFDFFFPPKSLDLRQKVC